MNDPFPSDPLMFVGELLRANKGRENLWLNAAQFATLNELATAQAREGLKTARRIYCIELLGKFPEMTPERLRAACRDRGLAPGQERPWYSWSATRGESWNLQDCHCPDCGEECSFGWKKTRNGHILCGLVNGCAGCPFWGRSCAEEADA